jgi:hypothetical protein
VTDLTQSDRDRVYAFARTGHAKGTSGFEPLAALFAAHRVAALDETGWRLLADEAPPKDAMFATAYHSQGRWVFDYAEWDEEFQQYCNWGCGFDYVTHWAPVTPPALTNQPHNQEG